MKKILTTLLLNTFQKEIRSKTLIIFFILSIIVIIGINAAMNMFFNNELLQDAGMGLTGLKLTAFYSISSAWGVLIAAVLGINAIKSDASSGVAHQILAFPIHPMNYVITRIIGTWLMVVALYVLTIALAIIVFSVSSKDYSFDTRIIPSFFISSLGILIIITSGAFLSMFFSRLMSFIALFFLSMIIMISNSTFIKIEAYNDLGIFSSIGLIFHYLFPRLGTVSTIAINTLEGQMPQNINIPWECTHFILSYALLVFGVYYFFKKRDFT